MLQLLLVGRYLDPTSDFKLSILDYVHFFWRLTLFNDDLASLGLHVSKRVNKLFYLLFGPRFQKRQLIEEFYSQFDALFLGFAH